MLKIRYQRDQHRYFCTKGGRVVIATIPQEVRAIFPEARVLLGEDGKAYEVSYYHDGQPCQVTAVSSRNLR